MATLATVYTIANPDDVSLLSQALSSQISLASALSLVVWLAFAPQCMSTLAVIRKETNSWRHAGLAFGYMFAIAYLFAWLTYRIAQGAL